VEPVSKDATCLKAAIAKRVHSVDGTRVDLVFGSNSNSRLGGSLRKLDAQLTFIRDFVAAWNKVMTLIASTLRNRYLSSVDHICLPAFG